MSWFVIDDQAPVNRKHRALMRRGAGGDWKAMAAGYLWAMAGAHCRAAHTDGVVDEIDLATIAPLVAVRELAQVLVEVGLWHDDATVCDKCHPPGPGRWVFHDWAVYSQRDAATDLILKAIREERNDRSLHEAVWERDRLPRTPGQADSALCVYCQKQVWRGHSRGDDAPELDHVFGRAIGPDGVAISCRECNRRKGNRSVTQAGMVFHPTKAHQEALQRRLDRSQPGGFDDLLQLLWALPGASDGAAVSAGDRATQHAPQACRSHRMVDEPSLTGSGCVHPDRGVECRSRHEADEPLHTATGQVENSIAAPQNSDVSRAGGDAPSRAHARTGTHTGARALSRPAGQGKARQGQDKAGHAQGRASTQPNQGTGVVGSGRRRRKRGHGKAQSQVETLCALHGDCLPCRWCSFVQEVWG